MNTPTAPVRVAIYARVSTTDQTCETQLRELRDYASRRGWVIAQEYVDTGWSGAKAARPELLRLLADAEQHYFDTVIVWKIDRFGRTVLQLLQNVNRLKAWGISFIATTQGIDTSDDNPMATFILHVMAAFAELERSMIQERVKVGMLTAQRKGIVCGRRKAVYDRDRARALKRAGSSVREIGRALGVGKSTVARLLAA
jgi:DNA invertase Pin-like site-specific DNA recombinase